VKNETFVRARNWSRSCVLTLFVSYKKELKKELNKNKSRMQYADSLVEKNHLEKFRHQDYLALALNYFVQ